VGRRARPAERLLITTLANLVVLLLYVAAGIAHARAAMREEDPPPFARLAALAGVVIHGASLLYAAVWNPTMPGFAESLSAVGFGVMLAYAWVDRRRIQLLGMYLAPVGAILMAVSFLVPSTRVAALGTVETSLWLPVHLGLVFAAIAGFFLEFVVGVAQLAVRRRLKRKQFAGLARFPSLETLDRIQLRSLVFGLCCLGLGIAAGGVWASSEMHHAWLADPKVLFTLLIWSWYAGSLGVRLFVGWHGRWSMALSMMGFIGIMFSVVGLDFITGGFHAYGG
jgi:ABC-type transport system involved in cytochrome c biogenesis permease subunit